MNRRAVFLIVLLCILALAGTARAVTLEQGWYANVIGVNVYTYDPTDGTPQLRCGAWFPTPVGTYDPFLVGDGGVAVGKDYSRYVSVPSTVTGASPADSLSLPLTIPLDLGTPIAYLEMAVRTNYQPSSMYIGLWHESPNGPQLLWSQRGGGQQSWSGYTANDTSIDGGSWYFRVQVVPEPWAFATLLLGVGCLACWRRRAS